MSRRALIPKRKLPIPTNLSVKKNQVEPLIGQGLALHQQGKFKEAQAIYEQVLAIQPNHFDALQLLGALFNQTNQYIKSVDFLTRALQVNPNHASCYYNRGLALQQLKYLDDALTSYDKAIRIKSDYAEAYTNRGNVLQELKHFNEAITSYDKAISINPNLVQAYSNRGNVLKYHKRLDEALESYDRAISINPDYAEAYYNRGLTLQELNNFDEAIKSYDQAIRTNPNYIEAYSNRGNALKELRRLEEALESYEIAISIKLANNTMFNYADSHWNLSLLHLLLGNFKDGWQGYEWRWKKDSFISHKRSFQQPLWLGTESLQDKTILLYAEQGLGDTIQFCRYVPLVAALGAKVIVEVPSPLINLLSDLDGVSQMIAYGDELPEFDFQCPLLSLPLAFGTTIDSIPNQTPYIHSSIENQNKWHRCIGDGGFKIAICWQGSFTAKIDVGRSLPVSLFEGLAKIDGVRLISLQKNEGTEQLKKLPAGMVVETLPEDFDSGDKAFLDSAAVMKSVDLVITSDTALTHLAGALGVNTWLLVKHVPDWRWLLDRNDSPWYPNHRLFRQTKIDDWVSVFKEMEAELKTLAAAKKITRQ